MKTGRSMVLDIAAAKDALNFTGNNQYLYDAILDQFRSVVQAKVEELKVGLFRANRSLYDQIMDSFPKLHSLDELNDSFLYPEVLRYLFHGDDIVDTWKFIQLTLDAEAAKRNKKFDVARHDYLWTSNGDFLLRYNKTAGKFDEFESFNLNDTLPLDFFSPYCIKVSAQDVQEAPGTVIDEYDYDEAYRIYEDLYDCLQVLEEKENASAIRDLIYKFTKVLLLKRQNNGMDNRHFFSSSDGYYIGRTILGNVEMVGREVLIDSIVHESVHSLLYMIDAKYPWQPSPAESDRMGNRILSPWSGNMLSVRNYLQAIFVWYGLFNLWTYAARENLFDQAFAKRRLQTIHNGFQQVHLAKISATLGYEFNDTLFETVLAIKEDVLKS